MYWLQLEYHVEGNKWILVFAKVFKKQPQKETMYVVKVQDLDFLRAYVIGLLITLAT